MGYGRKDISHDNVACNFQNFKNFQINSHFPHMDSSGFGFHPITKWNSNTNIRPKRESQQSFTETATPIRANGPLHQEKKACMRGKIPC